MWRFKKLMLQTEQVPDTLPTFSFYYRTLYAFDCYVGSSPHHPETESWVKYLDENGDEQTFMGFCLGPESPGVGAGCVEIIASSIVETSDTVFECTP